MAGTGRKRMLGAFLVGAVLGIAGLGPPVPARAETGSGCEGRARSEPCSQPAPCRDDARSSPCRDCYYERSEPCRDCYDRCDCARDGDEASRADGDADDDRDEYGQDERRSDDEKQKDDKQKDEKQKDEKQKDDKKHKKGSRLGKVIREIFD